LLSVIVIADVGSYCLLVLLLMSAVDIIADSSSRLSLPMPAFIADVGHYRWCQLCVVVVVDIVVGFSCCRYDRRRFLSLMSAVITDDAACDVSYCRRCRLLLRVLARSCKYGR
jgi:hypothetical protein